MAYPATLKGTYRNELDSLREKGIYRAGDPLAPVAGAAAQSLERP